MFKDDHARYTTTATALTEISYVPALQFFPSLSSKYPVGHLQEETISLLDGIPIQR